MEANKKATADQHPEAPEGSAGESAKEGDPARKQQGQETPGGRGGALSPRDEREQCEPEDEASDESFPASDAPAWTPSKSG